MQKSLLKNKWVKLAVVSMLCAVLVYFGTYATLAQTEENENTVNTTVTVVNGDGESTEYDISDSDSALAYVENYAENIQYDEILSFIS